MVVEDAVVVVDVVPIVVVVVAPDPETCTGFSAALFASSDSSNSPSSSRTTNIDELPAIDGVQIKETFDEECGPMYA